MVEPAAESVVAVAIETGPRRAFASALDWPGWSRSGRDEDAAVEALAGSANRYFEILVAAGLALPPGAATALEVTERLEGSATTDMGAPGAIAAHDGLPCTPEEASHLAACVEASWAFFDATVERTPAELRKGPRGGGRDRDAMVDHVEGAERAYARKIGLRPPPFAPGDRESRLAARLEIAALLRRAAEIEWDPGTAGWPPRYAARRIAWHRVDHAWEMQDKSAIA
ncbi:MAG: hypothetical protein JWM85_373 [Acidimicrobiaceae bacterium]|nr:hypothetical protein [Acidimicrobiaceae bacterium]